MRSYIISHMMTSVDGRIDCPMVGQLSTDEYYIALEKLGPCSKLSGRITTALECSAVKGESTPMEGTSIGHKSVYVASKSDEYTIIVDTYGKLRWQEGKLTGILYFVLSVNGCQRNIWKRCAHWVFHGLRPVRNALTCRKLWSCFTNISALNAWRLSGADISAAVSWRPD